MCFSISMKTFGYCSLHQCQQNRVTAQEPQAHISIRNLIISHLFFVLSEKNETKNIYERTTQAENYRGQKLAQHDRQLDNAVHHHFRIFPIFFQFTLLVVKILSSNFLLLVEHAMRYQTTTFHKHLFCYSFLMRPRMVHLVNPIYDFTSLILE